MRSPDIPRTVEDLRQTQRTRARSKAIVTFCKSLRRDHLFQPFWDAVGGAAGVAGLMAEFSLRDVRAICHLLGRTASAQKARPERHAVLAELVHVLREEGPKSDSRSLGQYYQDIVPACSLEVVQEWDEQRQVEWSKFQRLCLFRSHREWYEKRFLQSLFPPKNTIQTMSFSAESMVFRGNLALSEAILSALIADNEGGSRIPRDFMSEFVMPLLGSLFRRRKSDGETRNNTRDKFLYLVVQCLRVHELQLGSRPHEIYKDDLLLYAIQRWSVARDKDACAPVAIQQQTELCLVRLIEILPRQFRQLRTLRVIFDKLLLARKPHVGSYQLLALILRHARDYEVDIDDNTPTTLSRLKDIADKGNHWPMGLFLYLDVEDAISLFEKLSDINLTGNFLSREHSWYGSKTVLDQNATRSSSSGDAEIVRCLLYAKSAKKSGDQSWRAGARSLVHERRKTSEEDREWQQRAFWAKSAINLCVAMGDMELLDDTILWARRFNNQPLVARYHYNAEAFNTVEIIDLLSAVPGKAHDVATSSERVAAVTKAITTSGRVLIHIMETIGMTVSQPHAQNLDWKALLKLPKLVVDSRLDKKNLASFDALFESDIPGSDYPSPGVLDAVWKPTIDVLVQSEALLYAANPRLSLEATGIDVFRELRRKSGGMARADLASFLMQSMKTHLGPQFLSQRMSVVIELITGMAESDQPWLAIPFIRDLVLNSDGVDTIWHRQLLSPSFLSSLPYKSVSDLLYTMAHAIKEKMREQNLRQVEVPDDDGKPDLPAVKVTTIKMMAQLLRESRIIGPSAACDVLLGLLREARHIYSLVSIVTSLLAILRKPTCSPEMHNRVLDALEEKLAPVLSELSERRPLSEDDWAAAASGEARIPDVTDRRPLASMLLAQNYGPGSTLGEARARLIGLLVRAPLQSVINNTRWNRLFLSRNDFCLTDSNDLPAFPASHNVPLKLLSKFPANVPSGMFVAMREMALTNLRPPLGVARVTAAVKADRDLVNSNAGRHWLAQWDNTGKSALRQFGIFEAAELLQRPPEALAPEHGERGGITVELLADAVLTVADRLISCELPEVFHELVRFLGSRRFDSRANWVAWRENCIPLLKKLTEKVDGLRSGRAHLPDGEPLPRALPSSFRLRLNMLPIPYSDPPKEPAAEEGVHDFVAEVDGLLEWLAARRLPYHEEFAELKKEVRLRLKGEERARVALRLGRFNGGSGMGAEGDDGEAWGLRDYLRLELAGNLLSEAKIPTDRDLVLKLRQMVRDWVASDVELVRLMGLSLEEKHKEAFSE